MKFIEDEWIPAFEIKILITLDLQLLSQFAQLHAAAVAAILSLPSFPKARVIDLQRFSD